jgi:hypothetical protein
LAIERRLQCVAPGGRVSSAQPDRVGDLVIADPAARAGTRLVVKDYPAEQPRTVRACFEPDECANYLRNAGYAST